MALFQCQKGNGCCGEMEPKEDKKNLLGNKLKKKPQKNTFMEISKTQLMTHHVNYINKKHKSTGDSFSGGKNRVRMEYLGKKQTWREF